MSNTTTPSRSFTAMSGGTIRSTDINTDLNTLFTELQGNVGTANLLADAVTTVKVLDENITLVKLAAAVQASLVPAGAMLEYASASTAAGTSPTGWVYASGRTIGKAGSGATERANADTETLFLRLYANYADSELPVSGGRTGNAATDFANGKTITLPDMRGRVPAGLDYNNGGGVAARLNGAGLFSGSGSSIILGSVGGSQTLATGQLPGHTHSIEEHAHAVTADTHVHPIGAAGAVSVTSTTQFVDTAGGGISFNASSITGVNATSAPSSGAITIGNSSPTLTITGSTGSGSAHMQPAMLWQYIIKL